MGTVLADEILVGCVYKGLGEGEMSGPFVCSSYKIFQEYGVTYTCVC